MSKLMTIFDNQVRPLSKHLDKELNIKHIKVRIEEGFEYEDYIPVQVNYELPSGNKRILTARYIREMKHLGVLPR